jgi:hypothetical protein
MKIYAPTPSPEMDGVLGQSMDSGKREFFSGFSGFSLSAPWSDLRHILQSADKYWPFYARLV